MSCSDQPVRKVTECQPSLTSRCGRPSRSFCTCQGTQEESRSPPNQRFLFVVGHGSARCPPVRLLAGAWKPNLCHRFCARSVWARGAEGGTRLTGSLDLCALSGLLAEFGLAFVQRPTTCFPWRLSGPVKGSLTVSAGLAVVSVGHYPAHFHVRR